MVWNTNLPGGSRGQRADHHYKSDFGRTVVLPVGQGRISCDPFISLSASVPAVSHPLGVLDKKF